jgi:hypothetical protein
LGIASVYGRSGLEFGAPEVGYVLAIVVAALIGHVPKNKSEPAKDARRFSSAIS